MISDTYITYFAQRKLLKILHVTPYFGTNDFGGTERFVSNLAKQQSNKGHEIRILCSKFPWQKVNYSGKYKVKHTVSLKKIGGFNPLTFINPFNSFIYWADIVHIHSPLYFISIQSLILSKLMGKKIVLHIHGGLGIPPGTVKNRLTKIKPVFDHSILKLQLKMADRIITVNNNDVNYIDKYLKYPNTKTLIINNGVDEEEFLNGMSDKSSKNGKFSIIYIGDLEKWKSVDTLINAVSTLPFDLREKIHLTIIGDGKERLYLENLSASRNQSVTFLGLQPHHKISSYMNQSDLFIHTGLWEGMPTTLLEAALSEVPIISTSAGSVDILLGNNDRGLIFEPGSKHQLRNKIIWAMENYHLMKSKAQNARRFVRQNYSMEMISDKILFVYKELRT